MESLIAYALVIPIVQFCLTFGVWLGGFLLALCLAWAPMPVRTTVSAFTGGLSGVALAVAYGYGIFRVILGPESFGIGQFIASTVPLFYPIWNDFVEFRRVRSEATSLLREIHGYEYKLARQEVVASSAGRGSIVAGELAGLALVTTAWFLF